MGSKYSIHNEEDQSYKSSLGVKTGDEPGITKVVNVQWDVKRNAFQFDIPDVVDTIESVEPTKRDVSRATASFFDPLRAVSPVTILFKIFCQTLCKAGIGWDEILTGNHLEECKSLLSMMKDGQAVTIPRCLCQDIHLPCNSVRLVGFCDAFTRAYAAVIYLRFKNSDDVNVKFFAAKTRVAPISSVTIPRLELLSAVLLSKLITSVRYALMSELQLDEAVCFTDSKVSLFWIQGIDHE